jgi:hypothetical protein
VGVLEGVYDGVVVNWLSVNPHCINTHRETNLIIVRRILNTSHSRWMRRRELGTTLVGAIICSLQQCARNVAKMVDARNGEMLIFEMYNH